MRALFATVMLVVAGFTVTAAVLAGPAAATPPCPYISPFVGCLCPFTTTPATACLPVSAGCANVREDFWHSQVDCGAAGLRLQQDLDYCPAFPGLIGAACSNTNLIVCQVPGHDLAATCRSGLLPSPGPMGS